MKYVQKKKTNKHQPQQNHWVPRFAQSLKCCYFVILREGTYDKIHTCL